MTRIIVSLSLFFMFATSLQAQIFRGGWARSYNNNYYNNGYYNNGYYNNSRYYQQQPQQQAVQPAAKPQPHPAKVTTKAQPATNEQSVDYPYVYNPGNVSLTNAEKYIISEVNKLRARYRLPMLVVSPSLMNSSRAQTSAMTVRGMVHNLVGRAFAAAENIASTSSPSYAMNLWIGSSGHLHNMTGASYRFIGVGCFGGYATQQFSWSADVPYSLEQPKAKEVKKEEVKEEVSSEDTVAVEEENNEDLVVVEEDVEEENQDAESETTSIEDSITPSLTLECDENGVCHLVSSEENASDQQSGSEGEEQK